MSEHDPPPLSELDALMAAQLDFARSAFVDDCEEFWENQALMNEAYINNPRDYVNQLHFPDDVQDQADLSSEIAEAWVEGVSDDEEDDAEDAVEDDDDGSFSSQQPKKKVKLHHDEDEATMPGPNSEPDSTVDASRRTMTCADFTTTCPSSGGSHPTPSNDRYARACIATYDTALYRSRAKQSDRTCASIAEGFRKLQLQPKQRSFDLPIRQVKDNYRLTSKPKEDPDDIDGFDLVKKPESFTDSTLSSPVDTPRSGELLVADPLAEMPLLLQKLDDECLSFIVDMLYFPDVFSLYMTCKAMKSNTTIDLKAKKAQYRSALVTEFRTPQSAFCGVCLYMLPLHAYFHAATCRCCVLEGIPGQAERDKIKICDDCMVFRSRSEPARRRQSDAGDTGGDWVVLDEADEPPTPVWRPHRKIPNRPGTFLWFRDPDWLRDGSNDETYEIVDTP